MFARTILRAGLTVACVALCGLAFAALKVDANKSSVSAVFKQMNVPVEAKFRKFNATVDFNSAKPESSKASVDIDIPSFDLGDPSYNQEVMKKEWFDAAHFPKASFVSTSIKPLAGDKLDVAGKLTIKGKTEDVRFPLTHKMEGMSEIFEGALPIRRLAFNIGEGEWKDTDTVADEVVIKFRVVTAH